jgi:uncharacterized protein YndB with AHSA1/START domain
VDPVTVSVLIAKPAEEVFDYLADVANHPEFTDHFLKEFRLLREDSYGRGAGARFKVQKRFNRFGWGDFTFIEVDPPRRIVAVGRAGKYNRVKTYFEWTVSPAGKGTRVELTAESEPAQPSDRLFDPLGGRGWFRRRANRALRRLQEILEEGTGRGARATVAGS